MVDSSSEALLEEIRLKHRRLRWWRASATLGISLALMTWLDSAPAWAMWTVVVLVSAATLLTFRCDLQRKLTVLRYELNTAVSDAFAALIDACAKLQSCRGVWHLKGQSEVLDRKYHAGAAAVVSRAPASVGRRLPPYIVSNIDPIVIVMSKITIYGFPDRILVYRDDDVGVVAYDSLDCESEDSRFIEEGTPPSDATVVGNTWRYVNKGGGPDRRFNSNPQLPICRYDELRLRSGSGVNEILQLSRATIATDFVKSVKRLAAAAVGRSAERDGGAPRTAGANSDSEERPTVPVGSHGSFPAAAMFAVIFVLFVSAIAISLYFQSGAREISNAAPRTVAGSTPVALVVSHPKRRRSHNPPPRTEDALANRPGESSVPPVKVSSPLREGTGDTAHSSSASGVSPAVDDLAAVKARDAAAAERITVYCAKMSATAVDPAASEMACHRNEVAAWTRLVVDQEFPTLDAATLATCSQPPFPDSYEGLEACTRYQLHVN
jgi:hypothetical protein